MRGLYVHIPFCLKKCHYCNFVITTNRSQSHIERYLKAIEKEIQHFTSKQDARSFNTLYLGGGTPSALSVTDMTSLFHILREHFDFDPHAEITCEVNPGDVDEEKLHLYQELGINRISLGVQSFDEPLLHDMGRPHGVSETTQTMNSIKKMGFQNVSIDLICRLPSQSLDGFLDTVDESLKLDPDQVTLYDLEIHSKTAYGVRQSQGKLSLCEPETHFKMVERAEEKFLKAGLHNYALGCYAKPGFESKHNLIYWHNQEYLGLGPGAFSYISGNRYQFAESVKEYLEKCEQGDWKPDEMDKLTDREIKIETVTTGLRLAEGIDEDTFNALPQDILKRADQLFADGFLDKENQSVTLTRRGKFMFDDVMSFLLRHDTQLPSGSYS